MFIFIFPFHWLQTEEAGDPQDEEAGGEGRADGRVAEGSYDEKTAGGERAASDEGHDAQL